MCNTYVLRPKRGALRLAQRVGEAAGKLSSAMVRKSDPSGVEIMRWGFHRPFNPSNKNARYHKLEAGMWADAYRERRCRDHGRQSGDLHSDLEQFAGQFPPGNGGSPQQPMLTRA